MRFPYKKIEDKLGYAFGNKSLLKEAFTHKSYAHIHGGTDNDRLEYLGDAVLDCVISEWQMRKKPPESAGKMTAERQRLVCMDALDSATDGLGIWEYLLYEGTTENLKGKSKSSLFEAVVGAVFLDGGYAAAKTFVMKHGIFSAARKGNAKGDLQEYLQSRGIDADPKKIYVCEKSGLDHAPVFHCVARAVGEEARGTGKSKPEAEAVAAARLLFELKRKNK